MFQISDQSAPSMEFETFFSESVRAAPKTANYRRLGKRVIDVLLVLLASPIILLIVWGTALCVMADGRSPFFRQQRVGLNGRVFGMWKLRSMVPNAEAHLKTYLASNPEAQAEWDRDQKLKQDPRITPVGRVIRKLSIDELPQLWNVLVGDMSLVGPRPMMVDQQSIYPGTAYYAMRPGITGFWQTSVRNESSFAQRAIYDTEYLRKMSFWTDLVLLGRTVKTVLKATGC